MLPSRQILPSSSPPRIWPDGKFMILSEFLLADQRPLEHFDYTTKPPTEEEAQEAFLRWANDGWRETCDRCGDTIQFFPNSSERFNHNGPCYYHSGRPHSGYYDCCNVEEGSPGCQGYSEHVYKTRDSGRLASSVPFITTPENPCPRTARNGLTVEAISIDCEMVFTVNGTELFRLTAVTWPRGDELIDILVKPKGRVLSVSDKHPGRPVSAFFEGSMTWYEWELARLENRLPPVNAELRSRSKKYGLPHVGSVGEAREALLHFITPRTPIIAIIDTALLYPHPDGMPARRSLTRLIQDHFEHRIQRGGRASHDSFEDCEAASLLVTYTAQRLGEELERDGWELEDNVLIQPDRLPKNLDKQDYISRHLCFHFGVTPRPDYQELAAAEERRRELRAADEIRNDDILTTILTMNH